MKAAFAHIWGSDAGFSGIEFSGRTDRAILRAAIDNTGLQGDIADHLRRFRPVYYRHLRSTLATTPGRVLPGVEPLLVRLAQEDNATLAVGTGNFRYSAGLKLRHYGIDHHFRFGGFGDRTEERAPVIDSAIRAANRIVGHHGTVIVIGDTENDVLAAKANGAVAIAVATGTVSIERLEASGADVVLKTLEGAEKVLLGA